MRRRSFVGLGAAIGAVLASSLWLGKNGLRTDLSQSGDALHRIGFLTFGPEQPALGGLQLGLRDYGWIEGVSVILQRRVTDTPDQLYPLAMELVRMPVDIIVTVTTEDTVAAKRATQSIPIVMTRVSDAVGAGLISNQARPGGNVTGLSVSPGNQLAAKRVELLQAIRPGLSRIGVLADLSVAGTQLQTDAVRAAATAERLGLAVFTASTDDEIEPAIDAAAGDNCDALVVIGGALTARNSSRIAALALRYRLPSAFTLRSAVDAGGLMTYGSSAFDQGRRVAYYIDRVLRGAKPGDLPVEQPSTFQFVVNKTTAVALSLTIPPDVAAQVTEWIE